MAVILNRITMAENKHAEVIYVLLGKSGAYERVRRLRLVSTINNYDTSDPCHLWLAPCLTSHIPTLNVNNFISKPRTSNQRGGLHHATEVHASYNLTWGLLLAN